MPVSSIADQDIADARGAVIQKYEERLVEIANELAGRAVGVSGAEILEDLKNHPDTVAFYTAVDDAVVAKDSDMRAWLSKHSDDPKTERIRVLSQFFNEHVKEELHKNLADKNR